MKKSFTNELGNKIKARVTRYHDGRKEPIKVELIGPKSTSENNITKQEAEVMASLISDALKEAVLYRGDSQEIKSYDITKTGDSFALYGRGIYLTDNPAIAADYTVNKGAHDQIIIRGEFKSQKAAISGLLTRILDTELGWPEEMQKIKDDWYSRSFSLGISNKEEQGKLQIQYREALLDAYKKALMKAKKIYRERANDYRFVKDTSGDFSIVVADRSGRVSKFEIPDEYLSRCIPADIPLTDEEIKVLGEYIELRTVGSSDFRDRNNQIIQSEDGQHNFWKWVEIFKSHGSEYAWRDGPERMIGGRGINPTLDQIWHGQHGGYYIFKDRGEDHDFIHFMQRRDYTGIQYHGGIRVGDVIRGGGGIRHTSYVLWDVDFVNRCRIGQAKVSDPSLDYNVNNIKASSLYLRHEGGK